MKVLYLFNKVIAPTVEEAKKGIGHDNWLFGMLRLSKYGIETDFLEIEKYIPQKLARFLRKHILTMHVAHIPLFPLFFKYDVVFSSTAYGCLFLKALFGIKKFKWVILDFNILGTIQERKTLKQKIFFWSIQKGVDGIVAISSAEAEALKIQFPRLKDKIIFLHEALDTDFFKPQNIPEKNQIISVGNYARDFDTLIEATRDCDLKVLIAGKFSPEKASKLPSYVRVTQLNHADMLKAYAESKISVISLNTKDTYFDSVGTLTLGDSMAMGKATIVTHTKNMESYIEDGVNGVFVKKGDIEEMKKAILDLLQNEEKRKNLGEKAREFAVQKLDAEVFAKQLAIFLKSVV